MSKQLSAEQKARLARLEAVPSEKIMVVGIKRYLSIATVSDVLGKSRSAVGNWCRKDTVFIGTRRSPVEYNGCYLIPLEEVERVILEDDLPKPGNPRFSNGAPYPYRRRGRKVTKEPTEQEARYNVIAEECAALISTLSEGEGGEVILDKQDGKPEIKRLLRRAARHQGVVVKFSRTTQDRVVFTIEVGQ